MTDQTDLVICNLVSSGLSLKEAREKVANSEVSKAEKASAIQKKEKKAPEKSPSSISPVEDPLA